MSYIFHIGMGKTGTSSIQRALNLNSDTLAGQKAHYLGMWFSIMGQDYAGMAGTHQFFKASPEELAEKAAAFHAACQAYGAEAGVETFILSNESLFTMVNECAPFYRALSELADVKFVLYFRDPHQWLPSAFTQWSIFHKGPPGEIRRFEEQVGGLVHTYDHVRQWAELFGDQVTVREHAKEIDVVQDFAETIGFALTPPEGRVQERSEDAELVLRALFNNRFPTPVLPERFNGMVFNASRGQPPVLDDMIDRCFSMEGADTAIAENAATFEFIRDQFGLDFTTREAKPPKEVDRTALRERVMDYLIEITLRQSQQLRKLEKEIEDLKGGS